MTLRQTILKMLYPLLIAGNKWMGANKGVQANTNHVTPNTSFYNLHAQSINGENVSTGSLQGKLVMVVNTASDCGYTAQYEALQQLSENYKDQLVILGFPANDFKAQEKGNNEEIAQFCKARYGVTFPLMKKSRVIKSAGQHEIFAWLTHKNLNGWNDTQPAWNFTKYLINTKGTLTHIFTAAVSPLSKNVLDALQEK